MKTKDEGTAWLRSHGWIQCDRGWSKPGMSERHPAVTAWLDRPIDTDPVFFRRIYPAQVIYGDRGTPQQQSYSGDRA